MILQRAIIQTSKEDDDLIERMIIQTSKEDDDITSKEDDHIDQ